MINLVFLACRRWLSLKQNSIGSMVSSRHNPRNVSRISCGEESWDWEEVRKGCLRSPTHREDFMSEPSMFSCRRVWSRDFIEPRLTDSSFPGTCCKRKRSSTMRLKQRLSLLTRIILSWQIPWLTFSERRWTKSRETAPTSEEGKGRWGMDRVHWLLGTDGKVIQKLLIWTQK